MKNFENLKKALAVSVCSSILFSGAPKTSGKEESGAPKTSGKEKSLEDLNDDWNNLKVGNNKFRGIIIKKW